MRYFTSKIDYQGFFLFDRRLIRDMIWAKISQAAKAVYPVIGVYANNETGIAFPSEETLATLTGRTEKTVRAGIRGLDQIEGFNWLHYVTKHGRRAKKYKLPVVAKDNRKGNVFGFRRSIIEGGNWSQLTPSGQSLYPVMRHFGHLHFEEYIELPEVESTEYEYNNREFDLCDAELPVLAEYAGLTRNSVLAALGNLEKCFLIRTDGRKWRVFIKPPYYFKREYLNQKAKPSE